MALDLRRKNPRYALSLAVTVHHSGGGEPLHGRSQDVSKSGIFVEGLAQFDIGQRVELLIRAEDEVIVVAGKVVHILRGFGMGIEFSAMNDKTRQRLDKLVALAAEARRRKALG